MDNPVNYFEIASPNPAIAQTFYGELFNWDIKAPEAGGYSPINGSGGGLWDTSAMGNPHWAIFYVQVENVATSLEAAVALGATVVMPLVDNGTIEFAHLLDTEGNRFGIWHPKQS